jgi:hypothetical protein
MSSIKEQTSFDTNRTHKEHLKRLQSQAKAKTVEKALKLERDNEKLLSALLKIK